MKKYLIAVTMFFLTASSYAQLTVDSVGRVVIGDECLASNKLKVGDISAISLSTMKSNVNSILRNCNGGYNVSIYGETYPGPSMVNVPMAGVCGLAGNGMQGYNYGTMGLLFGNKNGAGIYGITAYSQNDLLNMVPGRYAGFFKGVLYVDGDTHLDGDVYVTSDLHIDGIIEQYVDEQELDVTIPSLLKIKPYQYVRNPEDIDIEAQDSINNEEEQRLHFGVSAKEVSDVYPNLVKKVGDGKLAVNYNEMIPLLIKSIQELQQEITELKQKYETK